MDCCCHTQVRKSMLPAHFIVTDSDTRCMEECDVNNFSVQITFGRSRGTRSWRWWSRHPSVLKVKISLKKSKKVFFSWGPFPRLNPLGPRPAAALFATKSRAKGSNCVKWSWYTPLKINNKHQTKVLAHFVFFLVCKYSVLVYPTGFDFFH